MTTHAENPLLKSFTAQYGAAPFDQIKPEHFLPAFEELIAKTKEEILAIADNSASASFDNTVVALAFSGQKLDAVSNIFFNLNSAETNEQLEALALQISPQLTEFGAFITQNEKLFQRIKDVYQQNENGALPLNAEDQMLLTQTYKNFVRSGAALNDSDKQRLLDINKELATKTLQFGQNVLGATNAFVKVITDAEKLEGLPEDIREMYAAEAKKIGKEGWAITLQYPSFLPAMTYLRDRTLRKEIWLANGEKNCSGNEFDNQELIRDIVQLRADKAKLLGYANYAAYVLEERMAQTVDRVEDFLQTLLDKAKPYAHREVEQLRQLAAEDGIQEMEAYDHAYYAEKLRMRTLDLSDEELKPFFALEKVEKAAFHLAEKLFKLQFRKADHIPVYHPEVTVYEVLEVLPGKEPAVKALLYTDYFPRDGKRPGAWMTSYRNQYKQQGLEQRPHISVVCNFSRPVGDKPSLVTFQEVTTLFHEFGHALHGILADTVYPELSGTNVRWDFVELPSQFLENYCYQPEFLQTFAKHYETGEILPKEKIEKLAAEKSFLEGYQTLRQVGFGLLDLAYHTTDHIDQVKVFEEEALAPTQLYPASPTTSISSSFSHIFQGGYAAGYYSYKWAEVLDADAFWYFKEHGIFNEEIADKYKHLLASGGTVDPMELYRTFRGGEPSIENLLKRSFGNS